MWAWYGAASPQIPPPAAAVPPPDPPSPPPPLPLSPHPSLSPRCGAPDAYLVGAGSCCCLKIEGYESAAGGGCCCVTIREVPKPRRPHDDDKDCWSVLHHCIHVCDCCEKCCD